MLSLAQTIAEPSTLQRLVLENPWPGFIALLGLAAVLRVVARRQEGARRTRLNRAAGVALLLGAALVVTAYAVETGRERVIRLTNALVDATVQPVDWAVLDGMITRDTVLAGPDGQVWVSAGEMRAEMEAALDRYRLAGHRVTVLAAAGDGRGGRVRFSLRTTFESNNMPPQHSQWMITWRSHDGRWVATELRWLEWANRRPPRGVWR